MAKIDLGEMGADKTVTLSSNVIRVSGPKTYVNEISYAKIYINSLNATSGEETTIYKSQYPILFYDVADNVVHSTYLVYNPAEISVMVVDSVNTDNSSAADNTADTTNT